MIAKSLIAAAAVVSSLVAVAPEQAKADLNVSVGIGGFGHPGYGYGHGWEPAPVYSPGKISCHEGKQTVRWSGFKMVQPLDCSAPTYRYRARKGGTLFRVSVNAFSGNIVKVKPF